MNEHSGVALVAAAIAAYEDEEAVERTRLLETARGGRPQVQHQVGRASDLTLRGAVYRVRVAQIGPDRFRVAIGPEGDAQVVDAQLERYDDYTARITIGDTRFRLVMGAHGPVNLVEVDGIAHRVSREEGGVVRSPAPALVVSTPVAVGAEVEADAPVLVLESMKMETVLYAPFAAKVRELHVSAGSQVETGAPLLRLEAVAEADDAATAPAQDAVALDLPVGTSNGSVQRAAERALDDLRSLLLGFDVDPSDEGRALSDYLSARADLVALGTTPVESEIDVLQVFADLIELSRNRPAAEDIVDERVHSPREHFHTYLHSLDLARGGLPDSFRTELARVLAHYGVTDLDRSVALEEAVFRIFLAQQRSAVDVVVVTTLLKAWLSEPRPAPEFEEAARQTLDHVVQATQLRFPVAGDLARSVRFRWFDEPLVDEVRADVFAGVRDELDLLAKEPEGEDRAERIDSLAAIPEPIVRFLSDRLEHGIPAREPMLEVLTRRHYREYALHDLSDTVVHGRPFVVADYTLDERPTHVVTTLGAVAELAGVDVPDGLGGRWTSRSRHGPRGTRPSSTSTSPGRTRPTPSRRCRTPFARCSPRRRSPTTYVASRWPSAPSRTDRSPTSRSGPSTGSIVEDELVRGVHPMVGRRLNLWRLREFDITRLEAPEDVLLYHCVARDNAADQRLVALGQVRQLAVVRDERGKGRRAAARRAGGGELPGGDPAGPRRARRGRRQARHEPRVGARSGRSWTPSSTSWPRCSARSRRSPTAPGSRRCWRRAAVAAPDGVHPRRACGSPTSRARAWWPRSRRRRPSGSSRSTTTPRRCCGRAAAGWSTPTSWRRC